MCSFRWPLRQGYLAPSGGGIGTGDWKTDGQHYRRYQGVYLPVPATVRGITEGECVLISKHVHSHLARCNPFHFHFLNVLVPTGFVLVGQKIIMAAFRKQANYATLGSHMFQPIALETLGPIKESAVQLLNDLGHRITSVSADDKEGQSSSNDSLSLCRDSTLSCCTSHLGVTTTRTFSRPAILICLALNPRDLYSRGY